MQKLGEKLQRIKESFAKQAPAEAKQVMQRATDDLRKSGILERIPSAGDRLLPFELPGTGNQNLRSDDLLSSGPLVISVYRGVW